MTSKGPGQSTPVSDDNQPDPGIEGAMAITLVTDDAPQVSTAPESLTSPPGEEQTHTMKVDDGDEYQPPASPVSPREDDILTGGTVVGVEGPTSQSHLPGMVKVVTRVPPFRRPFMLA